MQLSSIQGDVLTGLLSNDPAKAEATALRIYTEHAVFKHPFFIVEGRRQIARLWAWWNRCQQHMAPTPGLTHVWTDLLHNPNPREPSIVLDLTYEVVPFWAFGIFRKKHVARIVVMLHLVAVDEEEEEEGEEEERDFKAEFTRRRLFKIRRQEDFIQDDSLVSALLPRPFAIPALILLRWTMWLWGWCIVHVFGPLMVEVRAFI